MTTRRLGVVRYSNAAPLIDGLPEDEQRWGPPASVAAWWAAGEVDVALLPAVELARHPGSTPLLPGHGVAARGRCRSVLLFSRVEHLSELRRVRLDGDSRCAAALTRVLLARRGHPEVVVAPPVDGDLSARLEGVDAALLIGDPALHADREAGAELARIDLAAEWARWTGLPFVFACWALRPGLSDDPGQRRVLDEAAERGLARLDALAEQEAVRSGLPVPELRDYFDELVYRLDEDCRVGLERFLTEVRALGLDRHATATCEVAGT
ncbi:MAG: menaquinone biosynthesis protein [Acidobacteriota bacterium]